MVFSTTYFLFLYLLLVLAVYYVMPLKLRNLALLALSLVFYYWGEQKYVLIMVASTRANSPLFMDIMQMYTTIWFSSRPSSPE